ncbi:magnesium/cobalt transporter CorA [Luteithermobacter gelatinilyticus]|uniref:magnesium/cobalt transporter CorA n=1 Tax=Luteithermobacter gelatinilyticus TaxID=2582913 RepID=UPI001106321D|nr:magnesium/cobalt transporter CorA [Luteithermobacter gelatinilyticus]
MLLKNRKLYTRKRIAGASPGQISRPEETTATNATLILYDQDSLEEIMAPSLKQIAQALAAPQKIWLNITGLEDVDFLQRVGEIFNLHLLALEDIVHPTQRPKVDDYENQLLVMTRMAHVLDGNELLDLEQVSLVVCPGAVITFQLRPGDCFDPVRHRLRKAGGRIRQYGVDYLAYALLDAVVDGYFPVLEKFSDTIDRLETRVLDDPTEDLIEGIHHVRRDLLTLRRVLWPQREMLRQMMQDDRSLIEERTIPYFRDCLDHAIQLLDILETHRERASGLMDLYLSSISHKMNEVMKVLTLFATIFMPLGFIAGLYGMNFNAQISPWNMPELNFYYGYPLVLLLMLSLAGAMILYFAHKNWIRLPPKTRTRNHKKQKRSPSP